MGEAFLSEMFQHFRQTRIVLCLQKPKQLTVLAPVIYSGKGNEQLDKFVPQSQFATLFYDSLEGDIYIEREAL